MSEKYDELVRSCPTLFGNRDSFYFECGEGWYEPLKDLCEMLDSHLWNMRDTLIEDHYDEDDDGNRTLSKMVGQIKEKFGDLRFYMNYHDAITGKLIKKAEEACARTCEVCGQPGVKRGGGWIQTLCDLHHAHSLLRRAHRIVKDDDEGSEYLATDIKEYLGDEL